VTELALEPCLPPVWASGGHAQTILGHLIPSPRLETLGKEVEIPLPDGDVLVGFQYGDDDARVIYLFHGLGGNTDADYIQRTAALCLKRGYTVYTINHRGCGAGAGRARHPYHSGRAEDLSAVIAFGRARHPRARHAAIGFSLSANALLLLLGGERAKVVPDYAVAVNAPIDLEACSRLLGQTLSLNRIYDVRFLNLCRRDLAIKRRHGLLGARYNVPFLAKLRDFDEIYVAPAGGFKNREEYYDTCSAGKYVDRIRVPTVVLHAEDDPFIPLDGYRRAKFSPACRVHIEKVGGHMGYLSRTVTEFGTRRWQDYALDRALSVLERA
jgi:predicted alpha/beta-fold hydrolase